MQTTKDQYLTEVATRLAALFKGSKEGFKIPDIERHRLEGFMQAGVFMGLATNSELEDLMNTIHKNIFGVTLDERRTDSPGKFILKGTDYTQFERPAFERQKTKSTSDASTKPTI